MILSFITPPPPAVSPLCLDLDGSKFERQWQEMAQLLNISTEEMRVMLNGDITSQAARLAPLFDRQEPGSSAHRSPLISIILPIVGQRSGQAVTILCFVSSICP